MNEASVYLLKQNNDTKEIFSNNFFLSTFQSYHPLRENAPYIVLSNAQRKYSTTMCMKDIVVKLK